jgi:hypothetical protein
MIGRFTLRSKRAPPRSTNQEVNPKRNGPVVVGLGAIGLVALLVFTIRSTRSSTADEELAVPTTSFAPDLRNTDVEIKSSSSIADPPMGIFVPMAGVSFLQSVTRGPIGFFGLGFGEMPDGAPFILSSVDGVTWTTVDTMLGASGAPRGPDTERP